MKKFFSLLALSLVAIAASAQANFHLTPEGFKDDNGKSYVVFEREGTQAELYKRMHAALTSCFKNPKEVLSTSEPESIVISSVYDFGAKINGQYTPITSRYSMHVYFKDGKVRFDAPSDEKVVCTKWKTPLEFYVACGKDKKLAGTLYFFDNEGKQKWDNFATEYTNEVNGLVNLFMQEFDKGATAPADEEW